MIKIEKIYGRITVKIFGAKLSFLLPARKKNKYISLGYNCFVRTILTRYGIKPRRKQGELSCPFDLLLVSPSTIASLLENKFEGITSSLRHDEENDYWFNDDINAAFFHDHGMSAEQIQARYRKRAENFINISNKPEELKYIIVCKKNECKVSDLNRIYESLKSYRQDKPFKFIVSAFYYDTEKDCDIQSGLNPNIIYNQYKTEIPLHDFFMIWFSEKRFGDKKWIQNLYKNFIHDIVEA